MIKRILAPTDGSKCARLGMGFAIALAKQYGAAIVGIHVVDIKLLEGPFLRDLSASLGTTPYVNYQGNIATILEERGKAALLELEQRCAKDDIACETRMSTGRVAAEIVEAAALTDLIVMGRAGEHYEWLDGLLGSTTEAVIRRAGVPVLVTDTETPAEGPVLVAYDGSEYSKEALHQAVQLAEQWSKSLELLVVGDEAWEPTMNEAAAYLESHGISAKQERVAGEASEVIVAHAKRNQASLILMGAYGHTRVRELILGSTTAAVLNDAPCPVFLTR